MAHQLATAPLGAPRFRVLGMVFIDSVYPHHVVDPARPALSLPDQPIVKSMEELQAMKLKEKVDLNMTHARMMARRWVLPKYEGIPIPPTILLRAKENTESESQTFVDHSRTYRMLGWEKYVEQVGKKFIEDVVDIEGHHFSIFEFDKVNFSPFHCESPLSIYAHLMRQGT